MKKHDFQKKLAELHKCHNIENKVTKLAQDFKNIQQNDSHSTNLMALVDRYQTLDKVMSELMLAAAKKVKDTNKGYQMSPDLIKAMNRVKLWQEVLYRT